MPRSVFFVSDSTAMTAKGLGRSLLSQFAQPFKEHLRPYINTEERIILLVQDIQKSLIEDQEMPIVFASIMDDQLMHCLASEFSNVIDIFRPFMHTLEALMQTKSSKQVGQAHKVGSESAYQKRVSAIDFTLATDDGLKTFDYDHADIILLGVSRSGKTPTALYLALNFGLKVANYPFTADDLPRFSLIEEHIKNRHKLIGLCISPERLLTIRKERRAEGSYSSAALVSQELRALHTLFAQEKIPIIDTTTRSVEEIAASIVSTINMIQAR